MHLKMDEAERRDIDTERKILYRKLLTGENAVTVNICLYNSIVQQGIPIWCPLGFVGKVCEKLTLRGNSIFSCQGQEMLL